MQILHISTECYPAAKAGGLGDVAGALPKYLNKAHTPSSVIIPKYATKWIQSQSWATIYESTITFYEMEMPFSVQQLENNNLGFPLFVVDIPGKFDRPGVYLDENGWGYLDEPERAVSFQRGVLQWLQASDTLPDVLHCHDHHTGLIPFMVKCCPEFSKLRQTPTIFTIHNGEYHGAFSWGKIGMLPMFDSNYTGLLDWGSAINPLATAIKCAWRVTTVSPGYMEELRVYSKSIEYLLRGEVGKSSGILNGIDAQVWNPATDKLIDVAYEGNIDIFKSGNKAVLTNKFNILPDYPIITFIGRLAREKGADLLAPTMDEFLRGGGKATFIVLGTGEPELHRILTDIKYRYQGIVDVALEYNEKLAHQLYAGSDFLWMPSRVEPCGLNQMYAMRYGTIPIVRAVGGLKDTVIDMSNENGRGIQFNGLNLFESNIAIQRAATLYDNNQIDFKRLRRAVMEVDFSWEKSTQDYIDLYNGLRN